MQEHFPIIDHAGHGDHNHGGDNSTDGGCCGGESGGGSAGGGDHSGHGGHGGHGGHDMMMMVVGILPFRCATSLSYTDVKQKLRSPCSSTSATKK